MKTYNSIEVTSEMSKDLNFTDEFFFRELAISMMRKMPISEIEKILSFTKTDPLSKESIYKINAFDTDGYERIKLKRLFERNLILYEAEINTKD